MIVPEFPVLAQTSPWWRGPGGALLELAVAAVLGLVVYSIVSRVVGRIVRRVGWDLAKAFHTALRPPARVAIPLLFVLLARGRQEVGDAGVPLWPGVDRVLQLASIGVVTWLVIAVVGAIAAFVKLRHPIDVPDNREARRVHTQMTVIGRTLQVLVTIVGVAMALMTFPRVQQVGTGLLASAGIVGLAVGLAARPVLENLINGVQLGLTQPIRLDDVVVVDGEFGRVEEITLTYVVVRVWDERRLVLPFSKFITDSFQNWTRTTSQILGTVFLWVDYTASVERIRAAARQFVEASPLWDRRVFVVHVTETTDRTMQIRVLVSAADAGKAFDLRADVREKLIAWLQLHMPDALPRLRVDRDRPTDDDPSVDAAAPTPA